MLETDIMNAALVVAYLLACHAESQVRMWLCVPVDPPPAVSWCNLCQADRDAAHDPRHGLGPDDEYYIRSIVAAGVRAFKQATPEQKDELRRLFVPLHDGASLLTIIAFISFFPHVRL